MAEAKAASPLPNLPADRSIVMMGDDMNAPGGIATVVRHYRDHGLFDRWACVYVPTYFAPGGWQRVRSAWQAMAWLMSALLHQRVALLHVHCASRGSFWRKAIYCLLARLSGVRYVLHLHGGEFPEFYRAECGPLQRSIVRAALYRAATVVALTPTWEHWLRETFPGIDVTHIGNPVPVPPTTPSIRDDGCTVLFMGRIYREKGMFELIDAAATVCRAVPVARFVIAGSAEASFLADMKSRIGTAGLEGHFEFPGWVSGGDKDQLLGASDIFVLPSYAEGLPLGLLEAMAAARAVVTTPVGGIPDVVEDGRTGMLVPPRDSAALAEALLALLGNAKLRRQLGVNARQLASESYSSEAVLHQLGELYLRCGVRPRMALDRKGNHE